MGNFSTACHQLQLRIAGHCNFAYSPEQSLGCALPLDSLRGPVGLLPLGLNCQWYVGELFVGCGWQRAWQCGQFNFLNNS